MFQELSELRWVDALDITAVAILLYGGITWLRRSHAALVALGIALLAAVYGGARVLDMELTALAFQGFFAVLLVVLVVIFQEDLRQGFEDLAGWALGRREHVRPRLDTTQILVEALGNLAKRRIGALVVVPGLQPLRRHVHGGIELGGRLSVPLLESLFDPNSPGHDGAVVVENRVVSTFGVQLPLSRNVARRADLGTRHSAALGLAELTDACCVVVSEERGTISVASGGLLRQLGGLQELGSTLEGFFRRSLPLSQRRSFLRRLLTEQRSLKLLATGVATGLWLIFVPGSEPAEQTLRIPVAVSLPAGHELALVQPASVQAILRGRRRDFLFLDAGELAVHVDASASRPGRRRVALQRSDVTGQNGITVQSLSPESVEIAVQRR